MFVWRYRFVCGTEVRVDVESVTLNKGAAEVGAEAKCG